MMIEKACPTMGGRAILAPSSGKDLSVECLPLNAADEFGCARTHVTCHTAHVPLADAVSAPFAESDGEGEVILILSVNALRNLHTTREAGGRRQKGLG